MRPSNQGGFSLIEAIVAAAVAFMVIAAVSSSMISGEKAARAGLFYRQALVHAQRIHAGSLGIEFPEQADARHAIQTETKDEAAQDQDWLVYTIYDSSTGRALKTCLLR